MADFAHGFVWAGRRGGGEPYVIESAVSGSKFSRGDIVAFIGSSVSKLNTLYPSGADIGGVALAASNDSFDGKIPVLIPDGADFFLSAITPGTSVSRGTEVDIDVDANGRPVVVTSAKSARVVVVKGVSEVADQSVKSRVLVQFLSHSGLIDLS